MDLGKKPTPFGMSSSVRDEKISYPTCYLDIPIEGLEVGQELGLRFVAEVESISKGSVCFKLMTVQISGDKRDEENQHNRRTIKRTYPR